MGLASASRAEHSHGGSQAEVPGVTGCGVKAVRRQPAAHHVVASRRSKQRGRGVGEVPHLGPQPNSLGDGERRFEGRLLGVVGGVVRLVAAGEV